MVQSAAQQNKIMTFRISSAECQQSLVEFAMSCCHLDRRFPHYILLFLVFSYSTPPEFQLRSLLQLIPHLDHAQFSVAFSSFPLPSSTLRVHVCKRYERSKAMLHD